MSAAEKTLRPGQVRFVARVYRPSTKGKPAVWGIYDIQRGSWPTSLESVGPIRQDHPSEAVAQAEAERTEALR